MRCASCGEPVPPDAARCPRCGSSLVRVVIRDTVERCPRCGYRGEGIPHFRRPAHVALLVGISLFTYGIGGLVYWLVRRNHRICPNCGFGWEHALRALPPGTEGGQAASAVAPVAAEELPGGGAGRRIAGVIIVLLALIMVVVGIAEAELGAIVAGSAVGIGGTATYWWGAKALQARRQAVLQGLQRKVLVLATRRGGTLTVTEVAADLNLSLPAAEKLLISMDDGFRVRSDVTNEGIILYEFPEVRHRGSVGPGSGS